MRRLQSIPQQRAQLSLEYLLLLAAFFSVLLLMMPLIQRAYALALFGFDARQAVSFSKQFSEAVKQLSVLADDSSFSIEISPLHAWSVSAKEKKLVVFFQSKQLEKTKTIEAELVMPFAEFTKDFDAKSEIVLKKENGALVIYSNP